MDQLQIAKAVVSGLFDPAVLFDISKNVLAYNARFLELSGLRRRALDVEFKKGRRPFEMIGGTFENESEHFDRCLRIKQPVQLAEIPIHSEGKEQRTVHITFIPVLNNLGEPLGVIQSLRDVSGEARVQVRYRELLEAERLRAEHLERIVEERTRKLNATLEEVTRLSRVDPLTGLLNRRAFTEYAEQAIRMAKRHRRSVGVLVGDVDFFKKVNDTYGHQAGDQVLIEVGKLLTEAVRETDYVARFGGEEFVVLLSETASDSVAITGERLRETVDLHGKKNPIANVKFPTLSVGMAIFPDHGETLDDLLSRADTALYQAKNGGRNRAIMFDYASTQKASEEPRKKDLLPRVLVLNGSEHGASYAESLRAKYEVVVVSSDNEALDRCQHERYDVILADLADPDESVEFLRTTLRFRPEALRVLVIDTQDVFVEVRGTNVARVDCFLLRKDGPENLAAGIENGLARRELDRNRTMLDNDDVRRLFSTRLAELENVIEKRLVSYAYQPIVDPATREIKAYEALARAQHPLFKNATVLFEAAVQSGNLWRLGRLCRDQAVTLVGDMPRDTRLFVNLHPGEIDDPELLSWQGRIVPDQIVFEITERTAIPDFRRFLSTTRSLTARGYEFAIDDLGAGYASLNAVALLDPSFVKLDMTMVRGIEKSIRKQRLIKRMVEFANDVKISLIVEGVETEAEAEIVTQLGCHLAQGYFYGRPAERQKPQ